MREAYCENTAVGPVTVVVEANAVVALQFAAAAPSDAVPGALHLEAFRQLGEYFGGTRESFELPISCGGTAFQNAVWRRIARIPYGQTVSYSAIAAGLHKPAAARAVGRACHDNPIPIIIPCHRVIGKNNQLTGFAPGLSLKQMLLSLEARGK